MKQITQKKQRNRLIRAFRTIIYSSTKSRKGMKLTVNYSKAY